MRNPNITIKPLGKGKEKCLFLLNAFDSKSFFFFLPFPQGTLLSEGKKLYLSWNSQTITLEYFLQGLGKSISLPFGSGSEAFIHTLSHLSVVTHMPFLEIRSPTKNIIYHQCICTSSLSF